MPDVIRMPAVAANATEAVLGEWLMAEGASFGKGDVLLTVETEKAVVDVEAEHDGVLLRQLAAVGAEVPVGGPVALFAAPGEEVADVEAALAELGVAGEPAAPAPAQAAAAAPAAAPTAASVGATDGARIFASPLARRLAREAGLGLEELTGTGPGGRIVRRDVEARIAASPAGTGVGPGGATAAQTGAAPASEPSPLVGAAAFTDTPVSKMRRAVAARLSESKQTAPHFYLRGSARVDRLLALRAELNSTQDAAGDVKVSVNDLVVKAVARAHQLVPEMNVAWLGESIRAFHGADVAVAVATDKGLLTPVLRGVDQLSISAVSAALKDYAARAKAGRLQQSELEGGSISVTNLGMFGTEEFAAIINPPHAAILAVGAARHEPVVVDGQLEAATVMHVTLSVDHRPVDGVVAARWMQAFLALLEAPVRILA